MIYRNPAGKQKWVGGFKKQSEAQAERTRILGEMLSHELLEMLKAILSTSADQSPEAFIFGRNGTFIDPEYFTKWIAMPLIKKATDGRIKRFHDLRHFFVSMLIDQGETPKYIQDQVGHASINTTFDTYGHLMPKAKKQAAARLEKALFGRKQRNVRNLLEDSEKSDQLEKVN